MFLDASPRGACVPDHEERRDSPGSQPSISRDGVSKSRFPILSGEHRLHIRNDRFHLDDEQGRGLLMPGEDVDRTALATDRKGDFGDDLPPRLSEHDQNCLDQSRMLGIEEAIGCLAVPVHAERHASAQLLDDRFQPPDREPSSAAALDSGDQRLREARPLREVQLAPTAPMAQRSHDSTEAHSIHPRTLLAIGHRRLISGRKNPIGGIP